MHGLGLLREDWIDHGDGEGEEDGYGKPEGLAE